MRGRRPSVGPMCRMPAELQIVSVTENDESVATDDELTLLLAVTWAWHCSDQLVVSPQ
jgi:hypothetical protein